MVEDLGVAQAEAAAERVQADPDEAARLVADVLDSNTASTEAIVVAQWVNGQIARERGDLEESEHHFQTMIARATDARLHGRVALGRMSLAFTLASLGRFDEAAEQTSLARPDLPPHELARLDHQEALILQRLGRLDDARILNQQALDASRDGNDRLLEVRALSSLGTLEGYSGQVALGVAYLSEALEKATALDQPLLTARAAHNLGFLEGRRGNTPLGLHWFERAKSLYDEVAAATQDIIILEADRSALLLDAGLHIDAVTASGSALAVLQDSPHSLDVAELELLHARALLANNEPHAAAAAAARSAERFFDQRRTGWRCIAELFGLECLLDDDDSQLAVDRAKNLSVRLTAAGLPEESRQAQLLAARIALDNEDLDAASRALEALRSAESDMLDADRATLWLLTARLHILEDAWGDVAPALDAGLAASRSRQRRFGSSELQARQARTGAEIAELALRLALRETHLDAALEAIESARATSLLHSPLRPPEDLDIADLLEELRSIDSDRGDDTSRGAPSLDDDHRDTASRKRQLEEEIRRRSHAVDRSDEGDELGLSLHLESLDATLGDRTLLEYFVLDDHLHLLVRVGGECELYPLAQIGDVASAIDHLNFSLNRLSRSGGSTGSREAARTAFAAVNSQLEGLLLPPQVTASTTTRPVIVPTGVLHQLSWRSLPWCRAKHAVVAPSAAAWLKADRARVDFDRLARPLLVAGPELVHAADEVRRITDIVPHAELLTGDAATGAAVSAAIPSSTTAHMAAHGTFRTDNPMFSSLRLADGAFTIYELEQVGSVPELFVLPACQAAATIVHRGDELLGFTSALLAMGAAAVVAPMTPVADDATSDLMVRLFASLAEGNHPAAALTYACEALLTDTAAGDYALAAMASFGVFGAA